MDEITNEIIEKARNRPTCPFCDGTMEIDEEIDQNHTRVYCVRCSRTWIEVYDEAGDLVDMAPNYN